MAGTGLPIPKDQTVLPQPSNVIGAGAYSVAQSWQNIAQSARESAAADEKIASVGEVIGKDAGVIYKQNEHQAQLAQIASFEVDNRAKFTKARDEFSGDPEGFQKWADNTTSGALAEVPGWMQTHAKQFLSRETDSKYAAVLGEKRAQDKHIASQDVLANIAMRSAEITAIAASTGTLNSPDGKAAVATFQGVLDSAVSTGLMAPAHAQMLSENVSTQSQSAIIRKSVEGVYREKGYEAARAHLDETMSTLSVPYRVSDEIRNKTLGWLRSEEAGLRGERDAISKEWAETKKNIAILDPAVLQDLQHRAYGVGAIKVADDIQQHAAAREIVKAQRQLPEADQIRFAATGNLQSRLTQRESGGDPTKVNQFGYAGLYQFGAPRLADLGVYTPGPGENLAAWSKTPATATGKWSGTFNIPGFPDVKTLEDFKASPNAQKAAFDLHQQRTEKEIDNLGLGSYVGQTVGGVQITQDGLRAMVHLAGAEGTRKTLASGGAFNPADANGTTALDYARMGVPGDITGSRAGQIALGIMRKDLQQGLPKQIADLHTAISKTEFPPMEEIGRLGAKVHLLGNEEQKRQVAEMAAQAEYGTKFVTLPQAQRDELVTRWREKMKVGATDYERRMGDTVQTMNTKVTEAWHKDPYDAAARYSEGIAALPAVDWGSNTAQPVLAAKVAQQNTIRADQGLPAFSVLRPGEAQSLAATLVNGDPKQGSAAIRMLADTLPPDMYRATISDAPIKAALDGMVRSYDPNRLNTAMSVLDRAYRDDPIGFKEAFGDGTLSRLQTWQAHKDSLPPDAMAEYFRRADDPSTRTAREHLAKEADDKLKSVKPADVANYLGSVADRWVPFVNQAPPPDPLTANAMLADYAKVYQERYVDTADEGKAKAQAVERLKTVWGPSSTNGNALMRYPPERFYPQVDGSHDWLKRDLEAAIVASRFGEEGAPGRDPVLFGKPFTYKLISDARTDADVSSKRAPSYVVVTRDTASGRDQVPLGWDGKPLRFSFDPANAQQAVRDKFTTTGRPAALAGREALENLAASPGAGGP